MQILKNLFQVGGDLNGITFDIPGALWNDGNSYILKTPNGLIMFDCGCGNTIDQIFKNMEYWEMSPKDIKYCLLTHPHFDHAGGAHILKERGVELIAIEETANAISEGDERCCGYLYHKKFQPCKVDQVVKDGETLHLLDMEFKVMHFPGHSMGCTAFGLNMNKNVSWSAVISLALYWVVTLDGMGQLTSIKQLIRIRLCDLQKLKWI